MTDTFTPTPKDKFTFGLWTVGNPGRDPFGEPTRPALAPAETVDLLGKAGGVHGVNFHDNDLVPIDATEAEEASILKDFNAALKRNKLKVPMVTTNLFADPVFKDGAFTSNDAEVRAYAVQKVMRSMDRAAEFGAGVYVFWGGREGAEVDASKDPVEADHRFRRAINYLCEYNKEKGYGLKFALEAKPNEPRGHIYCPTTGHMLAFIATLDHPEMVGVNPEVAHEHMAGLNFVHGVAQAIAAGKLFHIDLNDQEFGRYDQDFRFGSANLKHCFFLVKLLEDNKYQGMKHFDAHAYRTSDHDDVIEFARGSMRTYLILKEKAKQWKADPVIKSITKQINRNKPALDKNLEKYTASGASELYKMTFDRAKIASKPLPYEKLDQRTMEILMGVT